MVQMQPWMHPAGHVGAADWWRVPKWMDASISLGTQPDSWESVTPGLLCQNHGKRAQEQQLWEASPGDACSSEPGPYIPHHITYAQFIVCDMFTTDCLDRLTLAQMFTEWLFDLLAYHSKPANVDAFLCEGKWSAITASKHGSFTEESNLLNPR